MSRRTSPTEAGFTLIEVLISLSLFALLSIAGLALVETVMRVEERTAGRLERLGQLQRMMFLITRDFEQIAPGTLEQIEGGVRLERQGESIHDAGQLIDYSFHEGTLFRVLIRGEADATPQPLVGGASSVAWTFFIPDRGWQSAILPVPGEPPVQPSAVAIELQLDGSGGPSGRIRRVVELPPPQLQKPVLALPDGQAPA
jgi:general secretion pathway protein J